MSLRYPNEEGEALSVQGGARARNKTPTTLFYLQGNASGQGNLTIYQQF